MGTDNGAIPADDVRDPTTGIISVTRDRQGRIQRRLIRKHVHGLRGVLTVIGAVVAIVAPIGAGSWWLTQRIVVTRDEFHTTESARISRDASVTEVLKSINVTLDKQEKRQDRFEREYKRDIDEIKDRLPRRPR